MKLCGFERDQIVYMLDTTDYDFDWSNFYTQYYQPSNIYNRDAYYMESCGTIDFSGSYVNPHFLMSYLAGDYTSIKRLSGKKTIKELPVGTCNPPYL